MARLACICRKKNVKSLSIQPPGGVLWQVGDAALLDMASRQRFQKEAPILLGDDAFIQQRYDTPVALGSDEPAKALSESQDSFG